jgi:hypothetical protein
MFFATMGFALALPKVAQAQFFDPVEPLPEDLPANGNINDLNGLQERQVSDWFPQGSISSDSQTILEINPNNAPDLTINDRTEQIKEQDDWQRSSPGEPKQTGSGIPLGTF